MLVSRKRLHINNDIPDLSIYLLLVISILSEGLRFPDPENEDSRVICSKTLLGSSKN